MHKHSQQNISDQCFSIQGGHTFWGIIQIQFQPKRETLLGFKKYFARGASYQLVNVNANVEEGIANGSFGRMHGMSFKDGGYWVKDEDDNDGDQGCATWE